MITFAYSEKVFFNPNIEYLKKAFKEHLPKECILRLFNMRDEIQNGQMPPLAVVQEWARMNVKCNFFETDSDIPDPRELDSEDENLMIFDDLLLEKQNKCECYYIRGKHSNVDCFYLAQNFFKLPRQTIRENANFICLIPQDLKNINHIYSDHMGKICQGKSLENFAASVGKNHTVFDLTSKKDTGKYRDGFDNVFIP